MSGTLTDKQIAAMSPEALANRAANQAAVAAFTGNAAATGGAASGGGSSASSAASDAAAYLARYPDVGKDSYYLKNPLAHYQRYGQKEGRVWGAAAPVAAAASPTQAAAAAIPASQPMPEIFGNPPQSWDAFNDVAQAQSQGLNQMPGVFSNYQDIPADPAVSNQLFYPASLQNTTVTNPLFQVSAAAKKK